MRLYVGTSGWAYVAWRGRFYPEKLPAPAMLAAYAAQLPAVEVNGTFRRAPTSAQAAAWAAQTPAGFRFAIKCPQALTHLRALRDPAATLAPLAAALAPLGRRLGPVLLQLPPWLPADLPLLAGALAAARPLRVAVEFRHPSWFAEETYAVLREHQAALVLADGEAEAPLLATAPFGYLRLRRARYAAPALARWRAAIRAQPWREAYVFFKHEDTARGPRFAGKLLAE